MLIQLLVILILLMILILLHPNLQAKNVVGVACHPTTVQDLIQFLIQIQIQTTSSLEHVLQVLVEVE